MSDGLTIRTEAGSYIPEKPFCDQTHDCVCFVSRPAFLPEEREAR